MALNRNLLYLFGAAVAAVLVWYFSDIVMYILIAWVLSMLGRPLMVFYQRRLRFRRFSIGASGAALLTILSFFLVITGIMLLFVPTIVAQARHLAGVDYVALGEKLRGPFSNLDLQLHEIGFLKPGESLATRVQELLSTYFKPTLLGDFLGSFISTAGNLLAIVVSVTFILFFFLKDNKLFLEILHALVPNEQEAKVRHALQDSSDMLTRYFGGLLTQIGAFTMICSIFLWMMGVPNALLIGSFGGILNVVPYLGPILGIIFGCFITTSSHLDMDFALLMPMLLKVTGAFLATQMIDGTILGPMIFSKSVQAHPLEIFIVTLVAAKLGGIIGMVIGIPVYTVLRVIARVFFSEFKLVQRLTDHLDDEEKT